jgi:voltage-gated potassium channel Kch
VKIVFYGTAYGTSDVCGPVLRALHASRGFAVPLVVTSPDAPVGRKRQLTESPVGQAARALGLPTVKPEKVRRNPELAAQLRAAGADIGVVVSYGKILPAEVLAIPRLGTVNVHLSLLPRSRGPELRCELRVAANLLGLDGGEPERPRRLAHRALGQLPLSAHRRVGRGDHERNGEASARVEGAEHRPADV